MIRQPSPPTDMGVGSLTGPRNQRHILEEAIAQMEKYNKAYPKMQGRGPAFEAADVPDNAYPDGNNVEAVCHQPG